MSRSKWVTIRDSVLDAVKFDRVTEDMKQDFTRWILEELLPVLEKAVDEFIAQIKEQAAGESGWCKIRDLIVLPMLIEGGLWLIEQALQRTVEATTT